MTLCNKINTAEFCVTKQLFIPEHTVNLDNLALSKISLVQNQNQLWIQIISIIFEF